MLAEKPHYSLYLIGAGLATLLIATGLHAAGIAGIAPGLLNTLDAYHIPVALELASLGTIAAGTAIFATNCFHWQDDRERAGLLEATANGLILFDKLNYYKSCNHYARDLLPEFFQYRVFLKDLTLADFLALLHDKGLSQDSHLTQVLTYDAALNNSQDFQDVIQSGSNKTLRVQIRYTDSGETGIVISDITNLKASSDRLQFMHRRNHELLAAIDAASSGIVIASPDAPGTPIVYANRALCTMYGLSRKDLEGLSIKALFEELDSQEGVTAINTLCSSGENQTFEITLGENDSGHTPHSFIHELSLVHSDDGAKRLIGVQTDQTQFKTLEAQMAQSQKLNALGNLAGGVAHDFNNVLSIIDGHAYLAGRQCDQSDTLHEKLDAIRNAVQRGSDLTSRLLAFGRHGVKTRDTIDIVNFLHEQSVLLHPLVGESVTLDMYLSPDSDRNDKGQACYVECVPDEMAQILINLVVNARDAVGTHGRITIALDEPDPERLSRIALKNVTGDDYITLSISDNGTGMDAATRKHIFEPFYTTKPEGHGTGLGLSMIYGFVTDMGGMIDIDSAPGEGTSFHLYLPRSAQPANTAATPQGDIDHELLRWPGSTVLVVEDEPDLLALVTSMLEQFELTVLTATDGNDALAVQDVCEGTIDLLLTDIVMPGLDGVHLAELFTALRPEARVIYMSGYPGREKIADITLPEQAILLAKPVRMEKLSRLFYAIFSGADEIAIGATLSETGQWALNHLKEEGGQA